MTARLATIAAAFGAMAGFLALLVRGKVTVDIGIGRTLRPLGPYSIDVAASPEVVFDVIAAPYLRRTPRALESKLHVIERGQDMALAAHFTKAGGFVTTTVETVRFEPPSVVHFRLLRGPVPHVVEQFVLKEAAEGTTLEYRGELGADLWALGRWWGDVVGKRWEATVRASLQSVKAEAERRASRRRTA